MNNETKDRFKRVDNAIGNTSGKFDEVIDESKAAGVRSGGRFESRSPTPKPGSADSENAPASNTATNSS